MRAMRIHQTGAMDGSRPPLVQDRIDTPSPGYGEVLLRVHACGVCHTEIDEIEGRTPPPRLPMTPGHQVVGTVVREGVDCSRQLLQKRVGVAWIHSACGHCPWCREGRENLCPEFRACGRDAPGGYADYMVVPESFVHCPMPSVISRPPPCCALAQSAFGLYRSAACATASRWD
jgi:propanol-preferring alcohol dehydrogenase